MVATKRQAKRSGVLVLGEMAKCVWLSSHVNGSDYAAVRTFERRKVWRSPEKHNDRTERIGACVVV